MTPDHQPPAPDPDLDAGPWPAPTPLAQMPPPSGPPVIVGSQPSSRATDGSQGRGRPVAAMVWAAVAVLVVGIGLLAGDWAIRTYEASQLLSRIEASESAMVQTQDQMAALALPENPTRAQRDQAAKVLQSIAGQGRDAVAAAGGDVSGVTFLPWHSALIDAQGAYLAHNQAWVDYLERGSSDVTVLLSDDATIGATWNQAERRVRAAMPWPTWASLNDRVEKIFTDQPADQDQGGQGGLPT